MVRSDEVLPKQSAYSDRRQITMRQRYSRGNVVAGTAGEVHMPIPST